MTIMRKAAPISLLISFTLGCTADSGSDSGAHEYRIPDAPCGINVGSDLLKPILPLGSEMSITNNFDMEPTGHLSSVGECLIEVNDDLVVYIDSMPILRTSNPTPRVDDYLSEYRDRSAHQRTFVTGEANRVSETPRETWIWPDFVTTSILCNEVSFASSVNVSVRLDWVGQEDYGQHLRRLIEPLAFDLTHQVGKNICAPV